MQSLIDRIKSFSWKVYVGAAVAGALATYKQIHPEAAWVDYALAGLAAFGFTVHPTRPKTNTPEDVVGWLNDRLVSAQGNIDALRGVPPTNPAETPKP